MEALNLFETPLNLMLYIFHAGVRGGAVCWGTGATSRKVVGSILDGVIGIWRWHKSSGRTMALGSNQPVTDIRTGNISFGVKAAGP